MDKKASRKEGGNDFEKESASVVPDLAEISVDASGGEEIDPSPKWWDEAIESERPRMENRRHEEGIESEVPRRKKPRSHEDEKAVEEESAPVKDTSTAPVEGLASEDSSAPATETPGDPVQDSAPEEPAVPASEGEVDPVEGGAAGESIAAATEGTVDLLGKPEIDLGVIKVKRQRKPDNAEMAALFGDEGETAAGPSETGEKEGAVEAASVAKPSPPPLPTDLGLAVKPPLIPTVESAASRERPSAPRAELGESKAEAQATPPAARPAAEVNAPAPVVAPTEIATPAVLPPLDPAAKKAPPAFPDKMPEVPLAGDVAEGEDAVPPTVEENNEEISPESPEKESSPVAEEAVELSGEKETEEGSLADLQEVAPVAVESETGAGIETPTEVPEENGEDEDRSQPGEEPASAPLISESDPASETGAKGKSAPVVAAAETGKKKAGCWTIFATLFFFATLFVLLLLVGAGIYGWKKFGDLEQGLAESAQSRFAAKGVYLEPGAWRVEFPRGIVLEEVTVFDDASKARPIVKVSDLGINLDFVGLAKNAGHVESAELSLRDSMVSLYDEGELYAEIDGVDGEIFVEQGKVEVERLVALVGGLEVSLQGDVTLPDAAAPTEPSQGAAASPGAPLALDFSAFQQIRPWLGLEAAEGAEPPKLTLTFEMDAAQPNATKLEGVVGGDRLQWRGVELSTLSLAFKTNPAAGELRFPRVQIGYGDGLLVAALSLDTATQTLRIEGLQSTVDPVALLGAYDASWAEKFKAIRLLDAPALRVTGSVPLSEPSFAALDIQYEHRQGFIHLRDGRELPLSDIRGRFKFERGVIETNDAAAQIFGGQALVNGSVNLTLPNRPFTGLIQIERMDLEEAAPWLTEEGLKLSGHLSLEFRGTGQAGLASLNGSGKLRVDEANLSGFPGVGPAQGLLGKIIPAFATSGEGSATGAYIVESGVLVTSDLTVRNGATRVVSNGTVNLHSMQARFVSTADLDPALASATGLTGKSVVIESSGSLHQPDLKILEFPAEYAAEALAPVLGTTPASLEPARSFYGPAGESSPSSEEGGAPNPAAAAPADAPAVPPPGGASAQSPPAPPAAAPAPATPVTPARPILRAIPQTEN